MVKISGVMPVKNEAEYLPYSLHSLKNAPLNELVVSLEVSCTDRSEEIIKRFKPAYPVKIYHKTKQKWKNPIAEAYEYSFGHATGDIIYALSADVYFHPKIFNLESFNTYDMVSYRFDSWGVHASIQRTYEIFLRQMFQRFGRQVWRGLFATRRCVWEKLHFSDVEGEYGAHPQFVDYKERLLKAGYKHLYVDATRNLELKVTDSKENSILGGKARFARGYPLWRVLLHSFIHFNPNVVASYIQEMRK